MRARKNGVVPYMDRLFKDERKRIVNWAVGQGKIGKQVKRNRLSLGRSSLGMHGETFKLHSRIVMKPLGLILQTS